MTDHHGGSRFVVLGAYVLDCFVRTDTTPSWGEDREVRSITTAPGGKALNQAVALARLGATVTALGAVGDDPAGHEILATLAREGVDTSGIQVRQGAATPICVCLVSDSGDTSFLWHIDADVAATPETVDAGRPALSVADTVLVTFEVTTAVVRQGIEVAHSHGARVIVQPAPPRATGEAIDLPWNLVDVLVPNAEEARALLGAQASPDLTGEDLAELLAKGLGVGTVVATLGSAGCAVHGAGVTHHYPAHVATQIVDTTGASDAFTAALAKGVTDGVAGPDAIQSALAAAAATIARSGGYTSMPLAARDRTTETAKKGDQ